MIGSHETLGAECQSQSSEKAGGFLSMTKFLFTQNPFYLVSCGLVLCGLQLLFRDPVRMQSISIASIEVAGVVLPSLLAAYAILMALTAVVIVRFGNVWEDARSIYIVIVIAILAISISFDEICVSLPEQSFVYGLIGYVFGVGLIELVILGSKIYLGARYRIPLYLFLATYFLFPVFAGRQVAFQTSLDGTSSLLFSILIGLATLFLIPAMLGGNRYVKGNGTPWSYPLFPLTIFGFLILLGAFRSHAIWMAFDSRMGDIHFEPFLLMPIGFALLIVAFELLIVVRSTDVEGRDDNESVVAVFFSPLLILTSLNDASRLPVMNEIESIFGSAMMLTILLLMVFWLYAYSRGSQLGVYFLSASLMMIGLNELTVLPFWLVKAGASHWLLVVMALVLQILQLARGEWKPFDWILFCVYLTLAGFASGKEFGGLQVGIGSGVLSAMTCIAVSGIVLNNAFAKFCRVVTAISFTIATGVCVVCLMNEFEHAALISLGLLIILVTYACFRRRRFWLWQLGLCSGLLLLCTMISNFEGLIANQSFEWIILQIGVICFAVGFLISATKANWISVKGPSVSWLLNRFPKGI